jgi:D-beta-D-heptose 7-phosphate kinase/D-beta-D-heptose 1-phosphate adenosyltransferase
MVNLNDILNAARTARVLVVGDVLLDSYEFCYTEYSRPSPEKSSTRVYTMSRVEHMLGGAGNVAANLTSLGVRTGLIGLCGNDGNYFEVKSLCDEADIDHILIHDETRPTPVKTRLYIDDEYHLRRDNEKTHKISEAAVRVLQDTFCQKLDHVDAVILSDYNKGIFTEESSQQLIGLCRERRVPVVVDFKPPNSACFRGATVVAPNLAEAETLVPGFSADNPLPGLRTLHDLLGAENILVTMGAKGMAVYDGNGMSRIDVCPVKALDPCGCGDTVRACLTLGLVNRLSLKEAAEFANYAASLVVQKLGTATLSPEELLSGKVD